jgi:hypothetical protein
MKVIGTQTFFDITILIRNAVTESPVVNIHSDMAEKNSVNMPNILRSTIIAMTIDPAAISVIKISDKSTRYSSSPLFFLISGTPNTTNGKVRKMKNRLSLNPAYSLWRPLPKDQNANKRVAERPR